MKTLLLCAVTLGLATSAVHSATLVASWTDFTQTTSNGYSLNLATGSAADISGALTVVNSTATQTASITGGELASRIVSPSTTGRLEMTVTMTFESLVAPDSGLMTLFSTVLSGNNNTLWGVGLTSDGTLQGMWNDTPWTNLTSSVIDLSQPFTLTATFGETGTQLYINGAWLAGAGGLRSGAGNLDTGSDMLYLGGVGATSPAASMTESKFTLGSLYIHSGAMTDAEVLGFYNSTVIPEPSTYAFAGIAGALVMAVAVRRRKNRKTK